MHSPYYSFQHYRDKSELVDTFYQPENFAWAAAIEANWRVILSEVSGFLVSDGKELKPYFVANLVNAPGKWKAFSFYFWGTRVSENACQSCPGTIQLLMQIPGIVSASVSVLEPHSEIKPHVGETDAIYRVHLGLVVPFALPVCGFKVGGEERSWEEGKLLIFNDSAYHTAWNWSDRRRVILVFDVLKPQYIEHKKWICARIKGNIIRQKVSETTDFLKGRKNSLTIIFSWLCSLFIWCKLQVFHRKSDWI